MTLDADTGPLADPAARGLILLTAQRDGDRAGEWLDALLDAGVDAELHIEDAARFNLTSTAYPVGAPFVYALFVPRADRARAAEALIEAGWDGRAAPRAGAMRSPGGRALTRLLLVAAASLAVVAVLILVRGG